MATLHRHQIIYRDMKSDNVLVLLFIAAQYSHNQLTSDFDALLIDFGTSRIVDERKRMTRSVGTTAWIAPEVFQSDTGYSTKADVYSTSAFSL